MKYLFIYLFLLTSFLYAQENTIPPICEGVSTGKLVYKKQNKETVTWFYKTSEGDTYQAVPNGNLIPVVNNTTGVTNLKAGIYKVHVINEFACESYEEVTVKNGIPTTTPTTTVPDICENDNYTLPSKADDNTTDIIWFKEDGVTEVTDYNLKNLLTSNSNTYFYQTKGSPCSTKEKIKLNIIPKPDTPILNNGGQIEKFEGENVDLSVLFSDTNNLNITEASGTSVGLNLGNELTEGIYIYYVIKTNDKCKSNPAKITVTIKKKGTTPTTTIPDICENDNYTLPSKADDNTTDIIWFKEDGVTEVTDYNLKNLLISNSNTYFYQTKDSPNSTTKEKIKLNIIPRPDAPILNNGGQIHILEGENVDLSVLFSDTNNLNITEASGTSVGLNLGNELTEGIYIYYVIKTNDKCKSAPAKITVTIKKKEITPTTTIPDICENDNYTLPSKADDNTTDIIWFKEDGVTEVTDYNLKNLLISNSNTYFYQTKDSPNSTTKEKIKLNIIPRPDAPILNNGGQIHILEGENVDLSVLFSDTSNLNITEASGTSVGLNLGNELTEGIYIYYVIKTNDKCKSAPAKITVTIKKRKEPIKICEYDAEKVELKYEKKDKEKVTWYHNGNLLSATSIPSLIPEIGNKTGVTNLIAGTYEVRVKNEYDCYGSDFQEIILEKPTPAIALNPLEFCVLDDAILPNKSNDGTEIEWFTDKNGLNPITNLNLGKKPVGIQPAIYYKEKGNNCSETGSININITPQDNAPVLSSTKIEITEDENADLSILVVSFDPNGKLLWRDKETGKIIDSNLGDKLKPGTYYYTVSQSIGTNNCDSNPIDIEVLVNPLPPISIPNAFTPNGDGKNDVWNIGGLEKYKHANIRVFDRSGKMILEKSIKEGEKFSWNGFYMRAPLPSTTYWYIIELPKGKKLTGYVLLKNRD